MPDFVALGVVDHRRSCPLALALAAFRSGTARTADNKAAAGPPQDPRPGISLRWAADPSAPANRWVVRSESDCPGFVPALSFPPQRRSNRSLCRLRRATGRA